MFIRQITDQHIPSGNIRFHSLIVRHGDQGFSLVESLIAILVLAIAMTAGLAYYFNANALYYRNLRSRLAVSLAEAKMEQCRSILAGGLPTASSGVCPQEANVDQGAVLQGVNARRTVTVSGAGYKDVAVFICWCEPGEVCDAAVCNETSRHLIKLITSVGP